MRSVAVSAVTDLVEKLLLEANYGIPRNVALALERGRVEETSTLGKAVLEDILENHRIAAEERVPVCQDCGLAVLFCDVGQDVHFEGGSFEDALHEGVRRAYTEGFLRKSVVTDPLFRRKNTGDNTPAVVHLRLVPGEEVHISVAPKGMGSENMSALLMMKPADGVEGVVEFVVETVRKAGPNPCPPVVIGVGIGGNFETAPLAAKRALLRPLGMPHPDEEYAVLERRLLVAVNALGIGPGGYGGRITCLGVAAEWLPTHIAGLPVAVNLCCHALRHADGIL